MKILAGDIGGTNTRLALFEVTGDQPQPVATEAFQSSDYDSLDSLIQDFQRRFGTDCQRACFGVAGPVIEQRCNTTNLPWRIEADALRKSLDIPQVWLLNDLEAMAWGIPALGKEDLLSLQEGAKEAHGNACIIAAGTGLGQAGLHWDGQSHHPFATEGGHCDFAPHDALEFELFEWLATQHGHVSWERILSGPGLVALYRFLCARAKVTPTAETAADISQAALNGECELCDEALERFVALYGAEAGNLALKQMASGGVFIGGGIAPKILPRLRSGGFLEAFNDKGRMSHLTRRMPVKIILNDKAALYGPARYAAAQAA